MIWSSTMLETYHLSLYNIKKDMLLTGPFAMLSMPSFDFHLPPCTEGFFIHLSPLWQLPLFPSVAQFPCVCHARYHHSIYWFMYGVVMIVSRTRRYHIGAYTSFVIHELAHSCRRGRKWDENEAWGVTMRMLKLCIGVNSALQKNA